VPSSEWVRKEGNVEANLVGHEVKVLDQGKEVGLAAEGKLKAEAPAVESLKWIRIKMVKSL
jgi:hypothetical protein